MPSQSRTEYYHRPYRALGLTTTSKEEPSPGTWSYNTIEYSSSRTDAGPVSSFRQKIASGQNATSSLTGIKRSLKVETGGFAARTSFLHPGPPQNYDWTVRDGDLTESFSPNGFSMNLDKAVNMAKMKFVNKALEALGSLEGQVFLGEIGETLRMIKNPLKSLRSGIDDYHRTLRKRRKGSKSHKRRVISDTWLEYKFGWQPLANDIEDGLKALQRISEQKPAFMPVIGHGFDGLDFSPGPRIITHANVLCPVNRRYTCTASAKIFGVVALDVGGLSVPRSELGFRLDRFVPTLWELLPYSFLVDYFSNVGDVISSWAFGTKFVRWAQLTTRVSSLYEMETMSYLPNGSPNAFTFTRTKPCKSRGEHVVLNRSPSISSLVPAFRMEIPGMASTKWLNIAALVRSRNSFRPY